MTVRRTLTTALSVSVALAGLVTVTAPGASGAPPINMQPRVVTDTTVWAAIKTVDLGDNTPLPTVGIAVNGQDDTVYIVNSQANLLAVINGRTGLLDDSISVTKPYAVAVDQNDDTIYVVKNEATPNRQVESRLGALPSSILTTSPNIDSASQLAVDSLDDTVYVARTSGSSLSYFAGSTPSSIVSQNVGGNGVYDIAADQLDDSVWMSFPLLANQYVNVWNGRTGVLGSPTPASAVGYQPTPVAVNGPDNRVYVADSDSGAVGRTASRSVYVIDGQASSVLRSFRLSSPVSYAQGLAVDDVRDRLFVAVPLSSGSLGIINEPNTDDSVYLVTSYAPGLGSSFRVLAVDDSGSNQGLVWAYSPAAGNVVQAFTRVSPTLTGTTIGEAGARVYFTVVSPEVSLPFAMDDTTVSGVRFSGGSFVTSSLRRENATTWSVVLPSGLTPGQVPVEVRFNGNQIAFAGYYTVQGGATPAPVPPPIFPPGAPMSVSAVGGVEEATVTWNPPIDPGTFSVSQYEAASSPGGQTCVTTSTTCTITGLTAGTSYTFTVRARSAAGWGLASIPSNEVIPTAPAPPGAPTGVIAQAGDTTAAVSWMAPANAGASPILEYEVVSSPGSASCSTMTLSCDVTGLTNGTSYTFTVRAKSAVGWGPYSATSNSVTPMAPITQSIMITGTRDTSDPRYIRVKGSTKGLVGKEVVPYVRFPGQSGATAGTAVRTVSPDGTFAWKRKTGKRIDVYFQHASIRSNTVNIAPR